MIKGFVTPKKYLFDINANCMIQLGIEVNQSKYVDKIINFLSNTVIGLHLKQDKQTDGTDIITHTFDDPPIFKLPNSINKNQNTVQQLSEMFISNYNVPPTTRLGSIGYNNKQVVLNISHSVGDGGYFRYIIENLNSYLCNNSNSNMNFSNIPYFPNESTEIFKDFINKSPDPITVWWNQSKINRVYSKKITKAEKISRSKPVKCKYITMRLPLHQLQNYSNTNKIHGLTDSLLTSIYIASNVHNYSDSLNFKFDDFISMPVCVDLRRYMQTSKIDFSICNNFSNVTPFSSISHNDTVATVGRKIKADMFRLMKERRDIGNLKSYLKMNFTKNNEIELDPKNGCGVELTYTGPLKIKDPITDAWMGHSLNVRSSTISLMGFAIQNERGKDEIILRLRFPPNVFDDEEAFNMSKSIEFCLKNVHNDWSIRNAIEKTCDFHKNFNF